MLTNTIPKIIFRQDRDEVFVKIPLAKVLGNPIEGLIPGWSRQMDEVCQKSRLTGQTLATDFDPFEFQNQPERGNTYWKVTVGPVSGTEGAFLGWTLALPARPKIIHGG